MSAATNLPTTPGFETQPGMVLGTIGYMSPEQVRGLPVDHRADLFAFGVILYEMLAGRRAFQAPTTADTMTAILKEDPPDLPLSERHIPPALDRIVHRCLEKSPTLRFQTASDLAFALEALSSHTDKREVDAPSSRGAVGARANGSHGQPPRLLISTVILAGFVCSRHAARATSMLPPRKTVSTGGVGRGSRSAGWAVRGPP
jgi:serine/threonine protein kinase